MPRVPPSQWGTLFNFAGGGILHLNLYSTLMADAAQLVAQNQPAAATWETLYTVPSSTRLKAAIILCANLGPDVDQLSLCVTADGSSQDDEQTIYPALPINSNDCFATIPTLALQTTGKIYCKSELGTTVFSLFGTLET